MNTGTGNTVLITGGGSGIGLALAQRFLDDGSKVILCGRSEERLRAAKEKLLGEEKKLQVEIHPVDVGKEAERRALLKWVQEHAPEVLCTIFFHQAACHCPL